MSGEDAMRLLVACPHQLLLVNTRDHSVAVVEENRGGYYGISWTTDGSELVLAHSGIRHDFGDSIEEYMDSEKGYLSVGTRSGVEGIAAPHQLVCDEQWIILTNTGRNALTVVRRDDLFYKHVWIDSARWDRKGKDRFTGKHFNSVHRHRDKLYLLAHNFKSGSLVAELSFPELQLLRWIPTHAYQAHNLWMLPTGELLTCNTMQGSVIEATTGRIVWKAEGLNQLTRGLAAAEDRIYVGMSQLAARFARKATDGGIWVLDRSTWSPLDLIPLPGAGNVHEVRVIDAPDDCHHGHILHNVPAIDATATRAFHDRAAHLAADCKGVGWTVVCGDPVFPGQDVVVEPDGELSLIAAKGVYAKDVVVSARIEGAVQKHHRHAGVIVRYSGPGDENMICALIELVKPKPIVSIWQHDKDQWKQLVRTPIAALPVEVGLSAVGPKVSLSVNGKKVLETTTTVLHAGGVGIRGLTGRYSNYVAQMAMPDGRLQTVFASGNAPTGLLRAA
jgi:hypothetical protein